MTNLTVVGGGVIGLSAAWRAARTGIEVTLYDPEPVRGGASWLAGGMLEARHPVRPRARGRTSGRRGRRARRGRLDRAAAPPARRRRPPAQGRDPPAPAPPRLPAAADAHRPGRRRRPADLPRPAR